MTTDKAPKPASISIYFNDEIVVIAASESGCISWISAVDRDATDEVLGSRILQAWDVAEIGDPDSVSREEVARSEHVLVALFEVDDVRTIRAIGANRLRGFGQIPAGLMNFVASELKGDDNRYYTESVEVSPDASTAAMGAAANQAMELTRT